MAIQVLQEYVRGQLLVKPSFQNFTEAEVLENMVLMQVCHNQIPNTKYW
jgi:hypothetical protein